MDTPKFEPGKAHPEEAYQRFSLLSSKLGIGTLPAIHISAEARAPDGVVNSAWTGRSRTYTRNAWNLAYKYLAGTGTSPSTFVAGSLGMRATNGTIYATTGRYSGTAQAPLFVTAITTLGADNMGVVVGTGATAESFESYALDAKIAHGTGSGQFTYNASSLQTPSYTPGSKLWTCATKRVFNNNSAGSIIVAETGLITYCITQSTDRIYALIERTVLPATITVLSGGQLTVTYSFSLTFPA